VVKYDSINKTITPLLPNSIDSEDDGNDVQTGYLTPDEPELWDESDLDRLPDSWFKETKKEGRVIKSLRDDNRPESYSRKEIYKKETKNNKVAVKQPKRKMIPPFYQKCFRASLTDTQYLTLQLLVLLLQTHRKVCLSHLATLFPQPILYESRLRNLQRFLKLPHFCVKLLWFPIIKHIVKQQFRDSTMNRAP
jgi:hypothetical protein